MRVKLGAFDPITSLSMSTSCDSLPTTRPERQLATQSETLRDAVEERFGWGSIIGHF
jgi:hypothetical protein